MNQEPEESEEENVPPATSEPEPEPEPKNETKASSETEPEQTNQNEQPEQTGTGSGAASNEFEFYFQFTKPLVLYLPSPDERGIAAAWVQKLESQPRSDEERQLRLNYLKLLLFVLQRGHLTGIFRKQPPSGPLQPFPQGFTMMDMGNLMIDHIEAPGSGGGDARAVPYTIEISNDLREFVAAQEVPNFGVQMYYAWSADEPVYKWNLFNENNFPKYIIDKIKLLKEAKSEEKGGLLDRFCKKKPCEISLKERCPKSKVKSPKEIEQSQSRSYQTYVGLVNRMGSSYKGICDDDQDKYNKPEQRKCRGYRTKKGMAMSMPQQTYDMAANLPQCEDLDAYYSQQAQGQEQVVCRCPPNCHLPNCEVRRAPMNRMQSCVPPGPSATEAAFMRGERLDQGEECIEMAQPESPYIPRMRPVSRGAEKPYSKGPLPKKTDPPQTRKIKPQPTRGEAPTKRNEAVASKRAVPPPKPGGGKCYCTPQQCSCPCPRAPPPKGKRSAPPSAKVQPASRSMVRPVTQPETRAVPIPETRAVPIPETRAVPIPETRAVPIPETRAVPLPEPRPQPSQRPLWDIQSSRCVDESQKKAPWMMKPSWVPETMWHYGPWETMPEVSSDAPVVYSPSREVRSPQMICAEATASREGRHEQRREPSPVMPSVPCQQVPTRREEQRSPRPGPSTALTPPGQQIEDPCQTISKGPAFYPTQGRQRGEEPYPAPPKAHRRSFMVQPPPLDIFSKGSGGRLSDMASILAEIKQKTEAHKMKCTPVGPREDDLNAQRRRMQAQPPPQLQPQYEPIPHCSNQPTPGQVPVFQPTQTVTKYAGGGTYVKPPTRPDIWELMERRRRGERIAKDLFDSREEVGQCLEGVEPFKDDAECLSAESMEECIEESSSSTLECTDDQDTLIDPCNQTKGFPESPEDDCDTTPIIPEHLAVLPQTRNRRFLTSSPKESAFPSDVSSIPPCEPSIILPRSAPMTRSPHVPNILAHDPIPPLPGNRYLGTPDPRHDPDLFPSIIESIHQPVAQSTPRSVKCCRRPQESLPVDCYATVQGSSQLPSAQSSPKPVRYYRRAQECVSADRSRGETQQRVSPECYQRPRVEMRPISPNCSPHQGSAPLSPVKYFSGYDSTSYFSPPSNVVQVSGFDDSSYPCPSGFTSGVSEMSRSRSAERRTRSTSREREAAARSQLSSMRQDPACTEENWGAVPHISTRNDENCNWVTMPSSASHREENWTQAPMQAHAGLRNGDNCIPVSQAQESSNEINWGTLPHVTIRNENEWGPMPNNDRTC